MSTTTKQSARPRRIDDALSQLVDSLSPAIPLAAVNYDDYSDEEEAITAAESHRHNAQLERAWRTIDAHKAANSADPGSPAGSGGRRGSLAGVESVNNAPDLIKRKFRRENPSPDKVTRFSNLYTRLLTQPVLSQKWGILYLLYKLSGNDEPAGGERSRSPLMDDGNLQNMLGRETYRSRRGTNSRAFESEDEGPAAGSSASQKIPLSSRPNSLAEGGSTEHTARVSSERPREGIASRASNYDTDREADDRQGAASPTMTPSYPRSKESVEHRLLRDLPFNLQGLSSSNLQFQSSSVLKLPATLPSPIISLLHSLAEPCLLYKELAEFCDGTNKGLVHQSLKAAISKELQSYLGLVATLEAEIRQALVAIGDGTQPQGVRKGGVTLKRCMVWTRDATMALRLMSLIVEESRGE
jgi:gamma-tubulin complex component 3